MHCTFFFMELVIVASADFIFVTLATKIIIIKFTDQCCDWVNAKCLLNDLIN